MRKQSREVPASSRPFGVGMRSGNEPFINSSHISATLSLYPPPQSSTLSPEKMHLIMAKGNLGKYIKSPVITYEKYQE